MTGNIQVTLQVIRLRVSGIEFMVDLFGLQLDLGVDFSKHQYSLFSSTGSRLYSSNSMRDCSEWAGDNGYVIKQVRRG